MPKTNYEHVDDWLDAPTTDERELPAKMWLEKFRAPAYKKDEAWLAAHALVCNYQGEPYRVVGCSQLGDVWLTSHLDNEPSGYEKRVGISDCSKWRMHMADGSAVDMHSPWRICSAYGVLGNFVPTIVDSCNRPLFTAHSYPGVYERVVELHNASLKPFVSEWEDLDDAAEIPADAHLHDDPYTDGRIPEAEGWGMFNCDRYVEFGPAGCEGGGAYGQIQRDDELDVFPDDAAAIDFVRAKALAGSPFHQKAVALHDNPNGPHHQSKSPTTPLT